MSKRGDTIVIQADYVQCSIFIDIESVIWSTEDIDKLFEVIWNYSIHKESVELEIVSSGKNKPTKQWIYWVSNMELLASLSLELVEKVKRELPHKDVQLSDLNKYD